MRLSSARRGSTPNSTTWCRPTEARSVAPPCRQRHHLSLRAALIFRRTFAHDKTPEALPASGGRHRSDNSQQGSGRSLSLTADQVCCDVLRGGNTASLCQSQGHTCLAGAHPVWCAHGVHAAVRSVALSAYALRVALSGSAGSPRQATRCRADGLLSRPEVFILPDISPDPVVLEMRGRVLCALTGSHLTFLP